MGMKGILEGQFGSSFLNGEKGKTKKRKRPSSNCSYLHMLAAAAEALQFRGRLDDLMIRKRIKLTDTGVLDLDEKSVLLGFFRHCAEKGMQERAKKLEADEKNMVGWFRFPRKKRSTRKKTKRTIFPYASESPDSVQNIRKAFQELETVLAKREIVDFTLF